MNEDGKAQLTTDEMLAIIEADKKHNLELCNSEINSLLGKYNCRVIAVPEYIPNQDGTFTLIINSAIASN